MMTTKEYRGLSPLERAAKLVSDAKCGTRLAAEVCSLSRGSVVCGTKAVKAGRQVGLIGRPRTFNASEEELFTEKIQNEGNDKKGATFREGKRLVRNKNLNFVTFFHRILCLAIC